MRYYNLGDGNIPYETELERWAGIRSLKKDTCGKYTVSASFLGMSAGSWRLFEVAIFVDDNVLPWSQSVHSDWPSTLEQYNSLLNLVKSWHYNGDTYRYFNLTPENYITCVQIDRWDGPVSIMHNKVANYIIHTYFVGHSHDNNFTQDNFPDMFHTKITISEDNGSEWPEHDAFGIGESKPTVPQWPSVKYRRWSDAKTGHEKIVSQITELLSKPKEPEMSNERKLIL